MASWKNVPEHDSYPCNRDFFTFLRKQKGWTQGDLARHSGYSERLISKAEAGRNISTSAIEVLADTFSTPSLPVFPEDLITDYVGLAKRYMTCLYVDQANGAEVIKDFLDEDVLFRIAGDPSVIPFAGEYHGLEGVRNLFKRFYEILEAPPNHDPLKHYEFVAKGSDVIVWGESWIHPKGQPLKQPIKLSHLMRFRQGKLYFLDDCFDTFEAAKVVKNQP